MRKLTIVLLAGLAWLGFSGAANATMITLDFNSVATGSNIIAAPLVTPEGTITASASGGTLSYAASLSGGRMLRHEQSTDSDYGQLAFDFSAGSVSFVYQGLVIGAFTAEVLDGSFSVLDSFIDSDTSNDLPGGPITLFGSDIRYFRFSDSPSDNIRTVAVDNVQIVPVPEPSTFVLLGAGLAGLAAWRRKRS